MSILFKSTRGHEEKVPCSKAILKGIAPDGGLYVPETFPKVDLFDQTLLGFDYKKMASKILKMYLTDFSDEEVDDCVSKAYDDKFAKEEIVPVEMISDCGFIELYHGATLAFKDMALSILPHLLKKSAEKSGLKEDVVILAATSGDTGKAALEGFSDVEGTKILVFYPTKGISEIQKRQMTTQVGDNVYVFGIDGNFDDAQNGVKGIFSDQDFQNELKSKGYVFSSANSINIGRLLPQIVYYFYAYFRLVEANKIKLGDAFNVVVPTGNFGNILASRYAKEMGLPINKFICASNSNAVLTDFFATGVYNRNRGFEITNSPSMDILISSNLERLIHLVSEKNGDKVISYMKQLSEKGCYEVEDDMKAKMLDFYGDFASEKETLHAIKSVYEKEGYVMDTHTAVGYAVYKKYVDKYEDQTFSLIASTASPYKFTRSVMSAITESSYDDLSDFDLISVLHDQSGMRVPQPIIGLEKKPIKHKSEISKNEMYDVIRKALR